MSKFKRVFVIVIDSVGVGEEPDAAKYGDVGSNTLKHAAESVGQIYLPNLEKLGLGNIDDVPGLKVMKEHKNSFVCRARETSIGKDTMTGHWEMMGVNTTMPFQTFTDTGFPKALIEELESKMGHKLIGNYSASGTEILKVLGEEQMRDNSIICYTSADSVLQLAAHEEVTGLNELYRCCEIAREVCMKPEYFVGRVIARPYLGTNKDNFKRVGEHRHDYTVSPSQNTVLDALKDNGLDVIAVGKINDIFNGCGVTENYHTKSNEDGMDQTIYLLNKDFNGLCYVNLVEFDSEFGHRRNPIGYARCLEAFDKRLGEFIQGMRSDDLLFVTADHGNDPIHSGTDHTREKVPFVIYSQSIKDGKDLEERSSFGDIGVSILVNFGLEKANNILGKEIEELFK